MKIQTPKGKQTPKKKAKIQKGKELLHNKTNRKWFLDSYGSNNIDPIYRHNLIEKVRDMLISDIFCQQEKDELPEQIERQLAIRCNFNPEMYEDLGTALLHKFHFDIELIKKYDPEVLVYMEDDIFSVKDSEKKEKFDINEYLKQREIRRSNFKNLIDQLTNDIAEDGHPLLQCRKCGSASDFMPLQIRGGDEPMTIFATCTNQKCRFKWKLK